MKPGSERARFLSFIATGGIAAGANMGARLLFQMAMSYEWAVGLAYLVGMVTAFVLARVFVFEAEGGSVHGQFSRFALVNAVAFAQVWLISVGLAEYLFPAMGFAWHAETVAHGIGVASPVMTSYLLHKHFSFRRAGA
jgi:putative flippase GtrA